MRAALYKLYYTNLWEDQAMTELRKGLEAAIRAAKLALFVIRKQGVMPNSSWESGFDGDLKTAEDAYLEDKVARAALAAPAVGGEALDSETIQILLDLLNPLHGALDYQIHVNSEGEHVYDAPPDYEHHVIVLAQQDRGLTQAVLILENRHAALPASQPAVGGLTESERVLVAHWRKWCSQAYTSRLDNAKTALLDLIPIIDRLAAQRNSTSAPVVECLKAAPAPAKSSSGEPVWPNNYMSNDLDKGSDA